MKLEMARGLFVLSALVVTSVAMASWIEPGTKILSALHGEGHCPMPRVVKAQERVTPSNDLLLLVFGLAQGTGSVR